MKRMYHNRRVVLLMVDFPKKEIRILTFHEAEETTEPLAVLPLSIVEDCYNLMLELLFGMRTRTIGRRFWCGIMIPEKSWSRSRGSPLHARRPEVAPGVRRYYESRY